MSVRVLYKKRYYPINEYIRLLSPVGQIPLDIWNVIGQYLPIFLTMVLSGTCKYIRNIIKRLWNVQFSASSKVVLSAQQSIFAAKINEILSTKNKYIVSAPMGWGKTIMALHYVNYYVDRKNRDETTLFVVPPATINKVWIKELTNVGLFHSDPAKSKVLVYHSTRLKHKKYYDPVHNRPPFSEHKIVIATFVNYEKVIRAGMVVDNLVMDEIHMFGKHLHPQLLNIKTLGLTAENISSFPRGKTISAPLPGERIPSHKDYTVLALKDVDFSDRIPDIQYSYYVVDNGMDKYGKTQVHIQDIYDYGPAYQAKLRECLAKNTRL